MRIRMQTPMQIGIQFRIQGIVEQILKKRSVGKKMFLFLCVSFALLNPDPHTESGSINHADPDADSDADPNPDADLDADPSATLVPGT